MDAERNCSGHQSTPLHKAALRGDLESLSHALECTTVFGNLDAVNIEGATALMLAAQAGHARIVRALVDAGADIEMLNAEGLDAAGLADAAGHDTLAAHIRAAKASRAALWAVITQQPCGRTSSESGMGQACSTRSRESVPGECEGGTASAISPSEDIMAKLLAEAGLPSGPKESPF